VRFEALLEAREAIEPAAARLAAIHRTDADLAEMTRIHRELDAVSDDASAHVRLNLEWHRAVVRASRNELMIAFFEAIADAVRDVTESHSLYSAEVHREVVRVHARVLAAIAAHDADAAFRRMQGHLGAYSTLVKTMTEGGAANANGKRPRKVTARSKR
jgi:DNA-binding FadR family transcriptional regulator